MPKAIGLITANYSAEHPTVLSAERPIASLPYIGRYRILDFAMSNLVNCGIRTVGFITPFNYRSIIDHVGNGRDWSLDRKNGGLFVLPGTAFGTARTGSRFLLRDFRENRVYLTRNTAPYVICTSANMVYNMDYSELLAAHESSGADITVGTFLADESYDDVMGFGFDGERVSSFKRGVAYGDTAFLDVFVIGREKLIELLSAYEAVDHLDLFEAISDDFARIDVRSHLFRGYVAPVFDNEAYFRRNMDLLSMEVNDELFNPERSIRTKAHDTPPAKYERGCYVRNSIISAGSRVWGSVADSVVGRNVVIESGATVRNSIVMQSCIIRSGARIENAIVDRNNDIPAGTELRGTPEAILIKEKGRD